MVLGWGLFYAVKQPREEKGTRSSSHVRRKALGQAAQGKAGEKNLGLDG